MKILFIGDVVGNRAGGRLRRSCPRLRQERDIDFIIANGENSAHGAGLTASTVDAVLTSGVEVITSGDHVVGPEGSLRGHRPRTAPAASAQLSRIGSRQGSTVVQRDGLPPVGVINLIGRVFMPNTDCPFRAAEAEVARLRKQTNIILVDLHAEATSEKIAMGRFLDGKVSAVVGTHTHVATADEQVLPKGTAYNLRRGHGGPHDSVLGRDVDAVLRRFLTQLPQKMEVAEVTSRCAA